MKQTLVVEDHRNSGDGIEFRVKKMNNTLEWTIGQELSLTELTAINRRYGSNEVSISIVEPKLPKDDEGSPGSE